MRSSPPTSPRLAASALVVLGLTLSSGSEAASITSVTDLGAGVSGLVLGESGQVAGLGPGGTSVDPNTNQPATPFEYGGGRFTNLDPGVVPIAVANDGRVIDARGPYGVYLGPPNHDDYISVPPLATAGNHFGELVGTGQQQPFAVSIGTYDQVFASTVFHVPFLYEPDRATAASNPAFKVFSPSLWIGAMPSETVWNGYGPLPKGETIPVALSNQFRPTGINDNGSMIGDIHSRDPNTTSFVGSPPWLVGPVYIHAALGLSDLGTLGGTNSHAAAISNSDFVVGNSDTATGANHAFLVTPSPGPSKIYPSIGKMIDLGTLLGMTSSAALGVNDQGQVVGWSGNGSISHAFLFSNGIMEDLNDRLPATMGLTLDRAVAINDAGQIVAYGYGADGVEHGYLLTTTPEPTALALLVLAGLSIGVRRLRNPKGSLAVPSA